MLHRQWRCHVQWQGVSSTSRGVSRDVSWPSTPLRACYLRVPLGFPLRSLSWPFYRALGPYGLLAVHFLSSARGLIGGFLPVGGVLVDMPQQVEAGVPVPPS